MNIPRSFTTTYQSKVLALENDCYIAGAIHPNISINTSLFPNKYTALWDTGAMGSVISKRVAEDLNLKPTGRTQVIGVSGMHPCNVYIVSLLLPNNIVFQNIPVTEGEMGDTDLLIGMDIISAGDFHISTYGNKTTFSFQIPSVNPIDYVQESDKLKKYVKIHSEYIKHGNNLCPCKSGKTWDNCHGRYVSN